MATTTTTKPLADSPVKLIPVYMNDATPTEDEDEGPRLPSPEMLMSRRTLTWVSTKTPATMVGRALEERVGGFDRLESGIPVTKITSRGRARMRVITVSKDRFSLFCTHHPLAKGKGVISTMAAKIPLPFITRDGVRGFTSDESLRDRFVRYIDVADIDAVYTGVVASQKLENSRTNRLRGVDSNVDLHVDQIVTIVHHSDQTLNLLVPNEADRLELVECLQRMKSTYLDVKKFVSHEALLLRYIWYDVDVNRDGRISEAEFIKILSRINFHLKNPRKIYKDFAKHSDRKAKGALTYSEVMTLLQQQKALTTKTMSDQIWDELFGQDDIVSAKDFLTKFCHAAQGETTTTMADVRELFQTLNSMELNHNVGEPKHVDVDDEISRARFEAFLYHDMNDAFDPKKQEPQDTELNLPIARYWINTSHNTYLTGDQLASASSVECYMKALQRGCKCLELDCWDGDVDANGVALPVVYHGHTMTSKILFADIIQVVKSYMEANPTTYPIILSLENHCSHPFQSAMASIMKNILGEFLYIPTMQDTQGDLPSPEAMRGKVVIKGKRPPDESDDADPEEGDDYDQYTAAESQAAPFDGSPSKRESVKLHKIVPELAKMTLFHGTKYKAFETSLSEPKSHMHSISETKIGKILDKSASNGPLWRLYNAHHMTRTYPAGTRVDSSNYNPVLAWSVGCQLVALNFQTNDTPLLLNDGMFRQCGNRGYLDKPLVTLGAVDDEFDIISCTYAASSPGADEDERDFLDNVMDSFEEVACGDEATSKLLAARQAASPSSSNGYDSPSKRLAPGAVRVKVRILSGTCLPKPRGAKSGETIDPYVQVTMHDVMTGRDGKLSYTSKSLSTSCVADNGFCPLWNEGFIEFVSNCPQVALLQFSLREEDVALDDKVADAVIPISCLRSGYRSIQLYDHHNTRSGPFDFARLLVEIHTFKVSAS